MLMSIAIIMLTAFFVGWLCRKIKLPSLIGMIVTGIVIGPHILNLIDESILNISAELRKIALIIILIRAGLKLDFSDLKKNGRAAFLLCFLPACLEIIGMIILAPKILHISVIESALLGSVIAAVSPAVIVPKMIDLIDKGYGTKQGIPQMILAGASVDDVFVIVMFTSFLNLSNGQNFTAGSIIEIPVSIIIGVLLGFLTGCLMYIIFSKCNMRNPVMMIVFLCTAFVLNSLETMLSGIIPIASLIGVMTMGMTMREKNKKLSSELSSLFDKLWIPSEVILFVLLGASVNIESAVKGGVSAIILVLSVLVFRMLGVFLCTVGTKLNSRERIFCMLAYMPKATVQAAIGGVPLAMGIACGQTVLTVSVIAILITAPLGALAIDLSYRKLLVK